jgi:hypothetical protein
MYVWGFGGISFRSIPHTGAKKFGYQDIFTFNSLP